MIIKLNNLFKIKDYNKEKNNLLKYLFLDGNYKQNKLFSNLVLNP